MCWEESPDSNRHHAPRSGSAGEGEASCQEWHDDRQCNRKQTAPHIIYYMRSKGEKVR